MSTQENPTATTEEAKPTATPVFGSSSTFGAGSGFAGFTGVTSTSSAADAAGDDEDATAPEEECQAEFKPVVQLDEVQTTTGEEDEEALVELKCKLYRFETAGNEWKERGVGVVKLLQHKENKKVRLLMRQDKTLKIRANHIVMPSATLQEHTGSDKAWVWSCVDFAEGKQEVELFCIRFGSAEKAQEFAAKFEEVKSINAELLGVRKEEEEEGAEAAESGKAAEAAEADKLADEVEKKL